MRVIVDTNILFSFLLSGAVRYREVLFDKRYTFYSPNFIMVEIFRHKERIFRYAKSSESEVIELLNTVFQRIHFIHEEMVSKENKIKALELCKGIDETDTPFVAMALELDAFFWTNDRHLKKGLIQKGFTKFFY